jgi:uncharacterized membrane protein (Fun14 family)
MAVKKVSRAAATLVGGSFLVLQLLAYKGYITVHWEKVAADFKAVFDRDGDGKVDAVFWKEQVSWAPGTLGPTRRALVTCAHVS